MIVIFEISRPFQLKLGYFRGTFKNKMNRRVWWAWFSIQWVNMDSFEYHDHIASGKTYWKRD